MKIEEIQLKSQNNGGTIKDITDEFCEEMTCIPTEQGKAFFDGFNHKVPPKLVRQLIFAGIYWATAHPDDVIVQKA